MPASWEDRGPRRLPKAIYSLRSDPRFAWCMHVPESFISAPDDHRLVVAVHGSSRNLQGYRSGFAPHADRHRWVVLAPLFPVGVRGDGDPDGYKMLVEGDIRYDRVLLAMVGEIQQVLSTRFPRFGLFGFSGGGQFAHRFLYVHPERLWGVTIGAPGATTRIDERFDYWLGTRNLQAVFGKPLDLDTMRKVPVQLLCGEEDTAELKIPVHLAEKVKALGPIGRNRIERMQLLLANYQDHQMDVRLHFVPGVGHEGVRCIDAATGFLGSLSTQSITSEPVR